MDQPLRFIKKNALGMMITKMSRSSIGPMLRVGARGKLDSQSDRTHSHNTTADRSDPRGPESRIIFLTSRILWLHDPKETDHDKRELPSYQDMPQATKRRPRPSESSRPKKPPKKYSTPLQARGLLSGIDIRDTQSNDVSAHADFPRWSKTY